MITHLLKNRGVVAEAVSAVSEGDFGTGTGSAVLHLRPTDDVMIEVFEPRNTEYHSSAAQIQPIYTSISGFIVA